ncbi:MAG: OmpA family protein [Burkholderiales bacterium]|nr:OmpA family protein [Burkholderiales bacterium]
MTRHPSLTMLSLAVLASLAAAPVLAQDIPYYYGGFGLGQSKSKLDQQRMSDTLLGGAVPPVTQVDINRNDKDTAYKLFGGYQFNRFMAIEGGYFHLGKFGFVTTTTNALAEPGELRSKKKIQGVNIDGVGTWPITDRFAAFARLGLQHAKASSDFSSTGSAALINNPGTGKRETSYKYGAGLQYAFTPAVFMRGEAETYRINDGVSGRANINVFSVSLVFPFGRNSSAMKTSSVTPDYQPTAIPPSTEVVAEQAAQTAQAPADVAPAVMTPPVVAAPVAVQAAAPTRQRVSFQAESLFAFDNSTMQPAGQIALNNFSQQISGTHYDVITVEGHTDRIGTPEYNQSLSLQRADAVKSYLVRNGKLDAGSISATGKSDSQPITKPGDCKGDVASPQLIECLKADRRVEIELTGKR